MFEILEAVPSGQTVVYSVLSSNQFMAEKQLNRAISKAVKGRGKGSKSSRNPVPRQEGAERCQ